MAAVAEHGALTTSHAVIELHLKCNEQKPDCISFQLRATNFGEERLLLPLPDITGLTFTNSNTGKRAEWFTSLLVSSRWAGITLAPAEHRDIAFRVRPCRVPRPEDDHMRAGDYFRWCVGLQSGIHTVYYLFSVDQDYFDGDSHWGFPQLQREAANQSAIPWLGSTVKCPYHSSRLTMNCANGGHRAPVPIAALRGRRR